MFGNKDKGEGPNKRLLPNFVKYTEWLRLSCLSLFLFIASDIPWEYLRIIGLAIALMSPVPISLISVRQGTYKALLAVVFIAAALFFPFGYVGSISFILSAGFLGVIFGIAAKKTNSAGEAIFALIISVLVSKLMFMWFVDYTMGYNPFALDEGAVSELMKSLGNEGVSEDVLRAVMRQISLLVPSFLIMASALDVFVNYLLVSKIEDRRQKINNISSEIRENEQIIKPIPPFAQWSFPRSLLTALFTAFIITLFDDSGSSRILLGAELNLKTLTSAMFFIQGLSFVWWWTQYKKFSYGVRLSIFIILLFIPIFLMGLVIIGITDIVINLREKIRRKN